MTKRRTLLWSLQGALAGLLLLIMAVEITIYSPPVTRLIRTLGISVRAGERGPSSTSLDLSVTHGPSDTALHLAAFRVSAKEVPHPTIFVFNDARYPLANVVPTAPEAVFDHLAGELVSRGYLSPVTGVQAEELISILKDTGQASHRAIVIVSGVLPAGVFSLDRDLLTPWVEAGGLCIWGGAAIGFWSGRAGRGLSGEDAVGEKGTERLLGKGIIRYPSAALRLGDTRSDFASALDISFRVATQGILRGPVVARGGLSLGWYSGGFSSISFLPRRAGGYLMFGGDVVDGEALSRDLAKIILSGAIVGTTPAISREITLSRTTGVLNESWTLPFDLPRAGVRVVAFDPNPDSIFFFTQLITQ